MMIVPVMGMPAKQMDVVMPAFELRYYIDNADRDQRAAGNERKCPAPFGVQCDTAPCNQNAQSCCEQNMTAPRHACHDERLRGIPTLRASCYNERKPVRRDRSMQK